MEQLPEEIVAYILELADVEPACQALQQPQHQGNGGSQVERKQHSVLPPEPKEAAKVWEQLRTAMSRRLVCKRWNELFLCLYYQSFSLTEERDNKKRTAEVKLFKWNGLFYLDLKHFEGNFSCYVIPTRGGWHPKDRDVLTRWYKVRFDPETLLVDTGDFTFTKSSGQSHHHPDNVDSVPFGTCFGCEAPHRADSSAGIDLRGTPLMVVEDFGHAGWQSAGQWRKSEGCHVVKLMGGGYCGWVAPEKAFRDEAVAAVGGWHIRLGICSCCDH
ncbi:GON domain-containing protein [Balamuthia mandrillaris]